jgi:DNA processing protein
MLPTVGPVRLRKLLEVFKEPQQILGAKRSELRKVEGIGSEVADQIASWESIVDLAAELARIRDFGATVIGQESSSYPKSLREIHAPPIVLYVWGELNERDHHAIGIIGARRTTHYCTEAAKKLAYQLAYAGLTVISGLARGIDTAAHQGALAAKGPNDCGDRLGLSKLYPPENRGLAEKFETATARSSRIFHGDRARSANFPDAQPNHFRLEPWHSRRRSRSEQRSAHHRVASHRTRPFSVCGSGPH